MTREEFLHQEREKRLDHPAKLRDFEIWLQALFGLANANNAIMEMAEWLRDPEDFSEPDLISMFAEWAKSQEYVLLLNHRQPVELDEEHGKDLGLYTVDEIDRELQEFDGMMEASEEHNGELYQATINRQLEERLTKWRENVTQPYGSFDPDEDDVWKLCLERDLLEYAQAGINVIRMQDNMDTHKLRLPDVLYAPFRKSLRELDIVFRKIIDNEKRNGRTYKDDTAPSTFWWRR